MFFSHFALFDPSIERVSTFNPFQILRKLIGASEYGALAGQNMVGLAPACDGAPSAVSCDDRRPAIGIRFEAILARPINCECEIGCVKFVGLILMETADVNLQRPLSQLNLHYLIAEVQEGNSGLVADPQCSAADVKFASRILIGPKVVARSQGTIEVSLDPILFAGRLVGD